MKKAWQDLNKEEKIEELTKMAEQLDDFSVLSDKTLKAIYTDLYGIEDIRDNEYFGDVQYWLSGEEIEETTELYEAMCEYLTYNYDATASLWTNMENCYEHVKEYFD